MNKAMFLAHFLLRPLYTSVFSNTSDSGMTNKLITQQKNKQAAVLIAIFNKNEPLTLHNKNNVSHKKNHINPQAQKANLHVLLTRRSLHLRHHPGQICFPGGKVEESDKSTSDTARRETLEEINVHCQSCDVIATLAHHQTLTGFNICPVVAFIEQPTELCIDENEVSEVFSIPLSFILNTDNYINVHTIRNNKPHTIYYLTYQTHKVWGATAAMLHDIAIHFSR